ncbi:uncharacterized protein LOC143578912 [Bidens hawaiensis]|uniref:uncharacterized protein LOC143578912 n=1 Tax=Bidens hawaiensis TaxID=980011 RepID=UPI004049122E
MDFENLNMKEDETIGDYFSRVMSIVSLRRSFGENITDQTIVEKVLRSLTSRFDYVVPSIEVSHDLFKLPPVMLMASLQSHEERINRRVPEKLQKTNEQKTKYKSASKVTKTTPRRKHVNVAADDDQHVNVNVVTKIVDFGCSNHMTRIRESFLKIDENFKLVVHIGDKIEIKVEGNGTIKVDLVNGSYKLLDYVYFVPKLEYNLLSVGQLMRKCYSLLFDNDRCEITCKATNVTLMSVPIANKNIFLVETSKP